MIRIMMMAAAITGLGLPAFANPQPYAGQDAREIAALSAQDIDDLLAGRGWGFAKPAELNGYPGPAHLLELADDLHLDEAQRAAIKGIFDAMQTEAQRLGADYVAAEARLDTAFAQGQIDPEQLKALTAEAGQIRDALRAVHLAAHLEVKPLLNHHQIMTYQTLRGYGAGQSGHNSGHGTHSHD